jgi:hypothetical protein
MQLVYTIRRRCSREGIIIYNQQIAEQTYGAGKYWRFQVGRSNFSVPIDMPYNEENITAVMEHIRKAKW